jgi:predicted HicB family RNase H-like nuclease
MTTTGQPAMAKKKSEKRRHTAMMRVDAETLDKAKVAASMMRMSLADYASEALRKAAERDIAREAKKWTGGEP